MFFKKKILVFLTIIFIFGLVPLAYAASNCGDPQTDDKGDTYYNCTCQGNNYPKCYVGQFISNPECACCGDCTLNDMVGIFTNYAERILEFAGIFAMLFLVVGGIIWMTSGGSAERIKKGTDIVKGAVIGLVIIFVAFTIIRIVMRVLGTEELLSQQSSSSSAAGTSQEWPACPDSPTSNKPWCYGCVWTGTSKGCQSEEVKIYQDELNRLGCNCGVADGKFGSQTKECTKRFQAANGLSVEGLVGQDTYKKLFESLPSDIKPCSF